MSGAKNKKVCMWILFCGDEEQAPGFPPFHPLKGGRGLFRAEMDVLVLPTWHPKGLHHVTVHIKKLMWETHTPPLWGQVEDMDCCWMEAAESPTDPYKSSMCVCVHQSVVLQGVIKAQGNTSKCVMHIIRLINDLIAVTCTRGYGRIQMPL